MQRATSLCLTVLAILLASPGAVDAKPTRKAGRASTPAPNLASDSLFEPGPKPAVTTQHDPEILNRGEMVSLLSKYSVEIVDALLDGERYRATAVREKDSIKLACIQDRLSNMKSMKRLADERLAATDRPAIRADELRLRHEFRGVELARERVLVLRLELHACVGDSLEVVEPPADSTTSSTSDPSVITPAVAPIDRPLPASPTS